MFTTPLALNQRYFIRRSSDLLHQKSGTAYQAPRERQPRWRTILFGQIKHMHGVNLLFMMVQKMARETEIQDSM